MIPPGGWVIRQRRIARAAAGDAGGIEELGLQVGRGRGHPSAPRHRL